MRFFYNLKENKANNYFHILNEWQNSEIHAYILKAFLKVNLLYRDNIKSAVKKIKARTLNFHFSSHEAWWLILYVYMDWSQTTLKQKLMSQRNWENKIFSCRQISTFKISTWSRIVKSWFFIIVINFLGKK